MSGRFRHLARHTIVYGIGSVLQRFVGFLLIPFYTQYLSPADYGVLALAGLLSSASQQIQLLGMPSALTRSVLLTARDDDERRAAIGSAGWAILVQSLVQAVLLALLAVPIAALVFGDRDEARWVWLIACGTPAYAIETFRNTLFRVREESGRYASVTLIAFTLNVGLNIFLVAGAGWGAFGVLAGQVLASLIMATLFLPWLVRALYSVPRPGLLRDMFGYALPLVPAGLCQWMLDLIDRYILRIYRPLDEVGLYSLGYRFGMVLLLFTMAFRIAWPQVVFTQARGDEE
jgi:O-antigen/teichoic acid export membrane protein